MLSFSVVWAGECWLFRLQCHVRFCPDAALWDEIGALSAVPICPLSSCHKRNHASTAYNRRTWHPTFTLSDVPLSDMTEVGFPNQFDFCQRWYIPFLILSDRHFMPAGIPNILFFLFELVPVLPECMLTCLGDLLRVVCLSDSYLIPGFSDSVNLLSQNLYLSPQEKRFISCNK